MVTGKFEERKIKSSEIDNKLRQLVFLCRTLEFKDKIEKAIQFKKIENLNITNEQIEELFTILFSTKSNKNINNFFPQINYISKEDIFFVFRVLLTVPKYNHELWVQLFENKENAKLNLDPDSIKIYMDIFIQSELYNSDFIKKCDIYI
ncbi:MAG: hypothetical protein WC356_07075 [Candidatus Micrarchaeia archaeon]|jgi:hypothetical protein